MIDAHVHIGNLSYAPDYKPLTVEQLISTMDELGIQKSVLLPLDSPEACDGYFTTPEALAAYEQYPDRFIPFCIVDPRRGGVAGKIEMFKEMGCVGFGEHKMGLYIDDPRCKVIYQKCNELGFSVLFHLDPKLNIDENGLPRLEKLLQEFPNVDFLMHGPGWWCEISGDCQVRGGYPKGKITPGGAVDRLLQNYPNIYGELSAGSGHNALTRDPDFTDGFFERNWKQLLFGTDYLGPGQNLPIVQFLKDYPLDQEKKDAIAYKNIQGILGG